MLNHITVPVADPETVEMIYRTQFKMRYYHHNSTRMKPSNAGRILIYKNSPKINGDNTPDDPGSQFNYDSK